MSKFLTDQIGNVWCQCQIKLLRFLSMPHWADWESLNKRDREKSCWHTLWERKRCRPDFRVVADELVVQWRFIFCTWLKVAVRHTLLMPVCLVSCLMIVVFAYVFVSFTHLFQSWCLWTSKVYDTARWSGFMDRPKQAVYRHFWHFYPIIYHPLIKWNDLSPNWHTIQIKLFYIADLAKAYHPIVECEQGDSGDA